MPRCTMHEDLGIHLGSLEVCSEDLMMHEVVGVGRTATVYRGVLYGNDVAVKEPRDSWTELTPEEQVDTKREIEIMKEVKHPQIVNLLGVQMNCNKLLLIIDFCKGGDLFSLLHKHDDVDLKIEAQVQVLHDVAKAMVFLHGLTPPVIHRDLKSLNILVIEPVVSEDDPIRVKVCDFGHSRKIGSAPSMCVGTPHWMAPEVLTGSSYDQHADVFSFAMVMFEVLGREVPFEDICALKVAIIVASGGRPDMEAIPPDCPGPLVDLMVRCWAQEPMDRPDFVKVIAVLNHLKNML